MRQFSLVTACAAAAVAATTVLTDCTQVPSLEETTGAQNSTIFVNDVVARIKCELALAYADKPQPAQLNVAKGQEGQNRPQPASQRAGRSIIKRVLYAIPKKRGQCRRGASHDYKPRTRPRPTVRYDLSERQHRRAEDGDPSRELYDVAD
jgi:hypothetical protein